MSMAKDRLVGLVEQSLSGWLDAPFQDKMLDHSTYLMGGRRVKLSNDFVVNVTQKIKQKKKPFVSQDALTGDDASVQEDSRGEWNSLFESAASTVDCIFSEIVVAFEPKHWKRPDSEISDLASSILVWMDLFFLGIWDKKLKHSINHLFVKLENDCHSDPADFTEYPEKFESFHKDGFLLVGALGRSVRFVLSRGVSKTLSRVGRWSLLQGLKKGLPHVSAKRVLESAYKHKAALSKEEKSTEAMLSAVERTTKELFKGVELSLSEPSDLFTFSHSSCAELGKKDDGVNGWAIQSVYGTLTNEQVFSLISGEQLVRMGYNPHLGVQELHGPSILACELLRELRQPGVWQWDETVSKSWEEPEGEGCKHQYDWECHKHGTFDYCWERRWGDVQRERFFFCVLKSELASRSALVNKNWTGSVETYVKFILEPLKVRTITKSPFRENALYTCLQKQMWKCLRRNPIFRLIGESVEVSHIEEIQERAFKLEKTWNRSGKTRVSRPQTDFEFTAEDLFSFWVSGDYSAATDGLHMDATKKCIDAMTQNETIREIMKKSLCGATVSYHNSFGMELDDEVLPTSFDMSQGQLMGCILSFPILCILNISAYRESMERYLGRRISLKRLPVIANGDDILFPSCTAHYHVWEKCIREVGFTKSPGKNYTSPSFCMINSTYFEFHHQHGIRKIPFPNMGMVFGQKKGCVKENDPKTFNESLWRLPGQFKDLDLLDGYPGLQERMERAILEHRRDIEFSHLPLEVLGFRRLKTENSAHWAFWDFLQSEKVTGVPMDGIFESAPATLLNPWLPLMGEEKLPQMVNLWRAFNKANVGKKFPSHQFYRQNWVRKGMRRIIDQVSPEQRPKQRLLKSCGLGSVETGQRSLFGEPPVYGVDRECQTHALNSVEQSDYEVAGRAHLL